MNLENGRLILFLAVLSPLGLRAETPAPPLSSTAILDRMEEAGQRQQTNLESWTCVRTYSANNSRLGKWAKVKIRLNFTAPGKKTYSVLESSGSSFVAKRVIYPILDAERQSALPQARVRTDINRKNYSFRFIEFDTPANAYVFDAVPLSPQRFQFRGRIWVDPETFGIKRVQGTPAVSPSFWVKRTEFTHEYERVSGFWLPVRHRSYAELRIFGRSTLEIDYGEYRCSEIANPAARLPAVELSGKDD